MVTKYPSLPIPTADLSSLHNAALAMRQTISLLIVNQQAPSEPTLTKASQIFATNENLGKIVQNISAIPGPAGPPGKDAPQDAIKDAPINSILYGRMNGNWTQVNPSTIAGWISLTDATDDYAAALAGVAVGSLYRNGSVLMVRMS